MWSNESYKTGMPQTDILLQDLLQQIDKLKHGHGGVFLVEFFRFTFVSFLDFFHFGLNFPVFLAILRFVRSSQPPRCSPRRAPRKRWAEKNRGPYLSSNFTEPAGFCMLEAANSGD